MTDPSTPGEITFRPLREDDMPLMHRWLNEAHVTEWYAVDNVHNPPLDLVERHYARHLDGSFLTRSFIAELDGRPIGHIQVYFVRDHPDYAASVQVDDGAAGVDLFIGEPDLVNRGLGRRMLRQFVSEVVFGEMRATACIIGPNPANKRAIRSYEGAGFRYLKTVSVAGDYPDVEYLMLLDPENAG